MLRLVHKDEEISLLKESLQQRELEAEKLRCSMATPEKRSSILGNHRDFLTAGTP